MSDNKQPKKPTFLYVVIAVLALSLAALGVLTFATLDRLASLQSRVSEMSRTVEEISASASSLIQQSMQLEELKKEEETQRKKAEAAAPQEQTPVEAQAEGTLSPSSGDTFTDNTDESMDQLLSQVKQLLPGDNGTWSVYVCNLLRNSEGSIENRPMKAASLIKLFIMGAVYENYDALSQQYGKEKLDETIHAMITVSDNDAANALTNWLGGGNDAAGREVVNTFCQAHGYTDTTMGRMLLAGTENGDNYTSVKDCGTFLKEIYQICNQLPTESTLQNAQAMYYHLKMQQRKNKIPAQMPDGVHVANKTGELSDVENDAGIIFDTAKGIDLVICFMSQDVPSPGAAQETIAANARAIYGYYNE